MSELGPVEILSQNLKGLLKREGMTQTALAKRAKVSQKTVSNAYRGASPVTIDSLAGLSMAFGYQPWQLLTTDLLDDISVTSLAESFMRLGDRDRQEILRHLELIDRDSEAASG